MSNADVIRQWKLLRTLEAARQGATVKPAPAAAGVTAKEL